MPKIHPEKDKVSIRTVIMGAASIALVWIMVIGIMIYGFGISNRITRLTSAVIPYPAALVGSDIITVGKLESQLAASRRFYESQDFSDIGLRVDFSTEQGAKRLAMKRRSILDKLIEISIIESEAKKRGIKVSDKDVSGQVDSEMAKYGTAESVKSDMERLYGWNMAQFEKNIVKPDIWRERLADSIRNDDPSNQDAKKKATEALGELDKGSDFADVARKYSDGESAKDGGSLGWFTRDQMLPEIANAVFSMNKSDRSGVIESGLGYHIVLLEDRSSENGTEKVKLSQVFLRTKGLTEWLMEKEKSVNVRIFAKGMGWDNESGSVVFDNSDMREFESNLDRNSPDDISVMF